jgi:ABC-2 type transport system ATP-binding protein
MDTAPVIDIRNLSHTYKTHKAVCNASFRVHGKSIHGFVGPNGAGKTTTLKILATLLEPQAGHVALFGRDIVRNRREVRRRIGFMPDHFSMYRQMTVFEYLDFFGAAYGLGLHQRDKTIAEVLALTDMDGRKNDLISSLSRGMQQRVSLARVLVHDPELLLLDEPASGLDPRARIELMEILQELRRLGKTIFISSHILSELAEMCSSICVMNRGQLLASGPVDEVRRLLGRAERTLTVVVLERADAAADWIWLQAGVTNLQRSGERMTFTFSGTHEEQAALLSGLIAQQLRVTVFGEQKSTFEEILIDVAENNSSV